MHTPELPHNLDAEKATLGSILLNREAIIAVAPHLAADAFYAERHAWIYEAMLACYERREPPDTRLVAEALRRRGRLDAIGGIAYLSALVDVVPTSYHVEHYARIVVNLARLRRLIAVGGTIASLGHTSDDPDAAETEALAQLTALMTRPDESGFLRLDAGLEAELDAMQADESPAIPTGLRDLDDLFAGGLRRQELTILAARPSVGKTALALGVAYAIGCRAADRGSVVLIASLEMSRVQIRQRLAAMYGGVDLQLLRANALGDDDDALRTVVEAYGTVCRWPILVDDAFDQSTRQIRSRALRVRAELGPIDLLVVDYLQLMSDTTGRKNGSREQDVSAISRGLKRLARELDCPVLALSQLSRAVESRQSKIPMLSDLRESGSLEQDADNVLFIYRDELYDPNTDRKGVAEIHVAKQRNGPLGVVPLHFEAATTRFADLSYRAVEGY